jgi:hypothetical protein
MSEKSVVPGASISANSMSRRGRSAASARSSSARAVRSFDRRSSRSRPAILPERRRDSARSIRAIFCEADPVRRQKLRYEKDESRFRQWKRL